MLDVAPRFCHCRRTNAAVTDPRRLILRAARLKVGQSTVEDGGSAPEAAELRLITREMTAWNQLASLRAIWALAKGDITLYRDLNLWCA